MPETPNFGRYAEIPYEQMTREQQEGYRSLIETRGALGGPSKIWVHNPKLAKVMGPVGAYFRTGYSLSESEREIAVVIINSKWHSIYPTNAHDRAGRGDWHGSLNSHARVVERKPRSRPADEHQGAAPGTVTRNASAASSASSRPASRRCSKSTLPCGGPAKR